MRVPLGLIATSTGVESSFASQYDIGGGMLATRIGVNLSLSTCRLVRIQMFLFHSGVHTSIYHTNYAEVVGRYQWP